MGNFVQIFSLRAVPWVAVKLWGARFYVTSCFIVWAVEFCPLLWTFNLNEIPLENVVHCCAAKIRKSY